jgi:pimeloyl-ACP methyl ester carboxylesterase
MISGELAAEIVPLVPSPGFIVAIGSAGRAVESVEPEKVAQPVGLIWGDRDPIVGVSHARDMESRLPDAKLMLIEGVSHSPMVEAPDQLVKHVLEFAA